MSRQYTISDGKMILKLQRAREGGFIVTSPLDPELITQAETIEEAFTSARDARKSLVRLRVKRLRCLALAGSR
ncbi:MAG: type II toxin-antitoxin system HicB family antitoxin [Phycisphaerae bacterium]|nr:type II toxin-antitoxin system HicB family antitoxin [Phycisphaerae bacterium]